MLKNILPLITLCVAWNNSNAQFIRTHSIYNNGSDAVTDSVAYYYTELQLDSLVVYHTEDGNSFDMVHKEWYDYDTNGFVNLRVYNEVSDGVVTYMWQELITNDVQGNILQSTMQTYTDDTWTNSYQTLYTYDMNGIVTTMLSQYWTGEWEDSNMVEYLNDIDGHISSESSYYYEGIWYEEGTAAYTYTDGLLTLVEYFDLSLEPYAKEEYSYNVADQLIAAIHYTWAFNSWFNDDSFYEYDENGNMIHEYWGHLEYSSGNSQYLDDGGAYHYYELVIEEVNEARVNNPVNVYPNPASNAINIELTDDAIVSISSTDGRMMMQQFATKGRLVCDASGFPSGVYIIQVKLATFANTASIIIE